MSNQNNAQNIQVQPNTEGAIGTANTAGIAYGGVGNVTYNNCVFQAPVAGAYHHAGGAAEQHGASTDPSLSLTVPLEDDSSTSDRDNSHQRASTDPSRSTTVPPVTVTTQDQRATPSEAAGSDLWDASNRGDLETVRWIVAAGRADVNYRGAYSWTPVMVAAYSGRRDVVEFLVGEGADPSLVDEYGHNILHAACVGVGHLETVKFLLSLDRVDVNARDNKGKTAADVARVQGYQRVFDLLVSRGADTVVSVVKTDGGHVVTDTDVVRPLDSRCWCGQWTVMVVVVVLAVVWFVVCGNGVVTDTDVGSHCYIVD